jgi:hypothetical protein
MITSAYFDIDIAPYVTLVPTFEPMVHVPGEAQAKVQVKIWAVLGTKKIDSINDPAIIDKRVIWAEVRWFKLNYTPKDIMATALDEDCFGPEAIMDLICQVAHEKLTAGGV